MWEDLNERLLFCSELNRGWDERGDGEWGLCRVRENRVDRWVCVLDEGRSVWVEVNRLFGVESDVVRWMEFEDEVFEGGER